MISLPRITRLVAAHRFDTLLDDILRNGRPLPLPLQMRLAADTDALPTVALALALQRFLELTLAPTPQALDLARALLDRQRPGDSQTSIAEAAASLAALAALQQSLAASRTPDPAAEALRPAIVAAKNDAIAILRAARDSAPTTIMGRPLLGDELDTLIALWQLSDVPDLAGALDLPSLAATLDDLGLRHDRALAPILERAHAALARAAGHRSTRAA